MEFEDLDYSEAVEGELASILRAVLKRCGGVISLSADELAGDRFILGFDHPEDGGICVFLHEGTIQ